MYWQMLYDAVDLQTDETPADVLAAVLDNAADQGATDEQLERMEEILAPLVQRPRPVLAAALLDDLVDQGASRAELQGLESALLTWSRA